MKPDRLLLLTVAVRGDCWAAAADAVTAAAAAPPCAEDPRLLPPRAEATWLRLPPLPIDTRLLRVEAVEDANVAEFSACARPGDKAGVVAREAGAAETTPGEAADGRRAAGATAGGEASTSPRPPLVARLALALA